MPARPSRPVTDPAHLSGPTDPARLSRLAPVDPRGARLAAALSSLVLATVLVAAPAAWATALLAAQVALFGWGAARGAGATPYAVLFRRLVRPRLGPPVQLEDPGPPRFAQAVGLVCTATGLAALLGGASLAGLVAVGVALAAALLNAAFGLCLGCEAYLLVVRIRARRAGAPGGADGARG